MMRLLLAVTVFAIATMASDRGMAADLAGGGARASAGEACFLMRRSKILDLSSADQMATEVERRFTHALEVSLADTTVANRSPRFAWSNEAKIACGKAIGYFKGREINEDMVSKCDCYHGRMLSFMH